MPIIACNIKGTFPLEILSIQSTSLSLIKLWGKVVVNYVEKSYVDKLDARKPRNFSLLNTSYDFLLTKKDFYRTFYRLFHNI